MRIAVDKNSWQVAKNDGNEYIYVYQDESLEDLMKTKIVCKELDEIDNVDINTTNYNINCRKKCKITDKDWNIIPPKKDYKIGIIIPNYNYEHTIIKCIGSILKQTYQNFEIIFIDDISTDGSIEKVKAFNSDKIKIVELKQKRLNGGARNEGYLYLSDDVDYVYYIDSDDWLYDENCLKDINDALESEPDVLFVGLAKYKKGKTEIYDIPEYKDKYEAIKGWSGSCGKVIKKSLATRQECLYNEGTLKEDKNQHCRICIYMNNFQTLRKPIYVWNQSNYKSVTTIRKKNILWETSTIRQYADTLELALTVKGKDKKIDEILEDRVRLAKNEFLSGGDKQW